MKLLQISSMVPFPPDDGGRVGIYHITRQFIRHGVDVHFAAPRLYANDANGFSKDVTLHLLDIDPRNSVVGAIRNFWSELPYNIDKYYSGRALQQLEGIAVKEKFDAIHVEYLNLARYGVELKRRFQMPTVLREHNFQAEIIRRLRDNTANFLMRSYADVQFKRMLHYECETIQEFDAIVPVSAVDDAKLRQLVPNIRSVVIPAGVDTNALQYHTCLSNDAVLFLTTYEWLPNRDSFDYYVLEILPLVRARAPEVRTIVVGKHTEKIRERKRVQGIEVRGFVPDMNVLPSIAPVAVVPLRIGSGVRIKLLDLMALGIAVVSTSIGAEGIDVTHGRDIIIADDPSAIAEAITKLLQSPDEAARIGQNARRLVEERYSWNSVGDRFFDLYSSLIASHKN